MTEIIKGYRALRQDLTAKQNGFSFVDWETVREYFQPGLIRVCNSVERPKEPTNGFHYCRKAIDVLEYYSAASRFFEIEDIGTDRDESGNKSATNKIRFIRELTREEMIELCGFEKENLGKDNFGYRNTGYSNTGNRNTGNSNTGDSNTGNSNTGDSNTGNSNTGYSNTGNRNTGYSNTGNRNTGYSNTGDSNTGNSNTGNRNTGDWNKANFQTGFFNTKTPINIDVFNKKCSKKKWDDAEKPSFIFNVTPNIWVSWDEMTDQEKIDHECAYTQYGYMKSISMEDAWKEAFRNASNHDIELLKGLPNYNYEVFKEITGIDDDRLK